MAIHAPRAGTLLAYTLLTDPPVVRASGKDDPEPLRVMLKITAGEGSTTYLQKIEIRYRIGNDEAALSPTEPSTVGMVVERRSPTDLGGTWTRSKRRDGENAVFTFTPETDFDPCELSGSDTVTLALTGLSASETIGTCYVDVTEWTSTTDSGYQPRPVDPLPVDKWPTDFTFHNLRPDHISVERGESVTLRWEASLGPRYWMHWDSDKTSVTGLSTWPSPELTSTTAFMLVAERSVDGGGTPMIYALTTAVTVREPDLKVGNLEVNGIVQVQGARQDLDAPTPAPTDNIRYFQAPTDGTVVGYVQAASGGPAATVAVTVSRTGVNEYTMRFTSDNSVSSRPPTETPINVPVPRGAQLTVRLFGQQGDSSGLTWLPRGVGQLTAITPPAS
ncbi:hypothetical protein [Frankia sp. QA3]|uniref:hypothetical protein n=1 Tax=Frankia sp. QA3 TaxID=710111 RepID=UPI000269BFF4|nr:hypothetical protein [Frankia sp. QA3]EIV92476.1 hypothetical protein FraQA3DRAFT_2044 [Frankia sp. QA3]